MSRSEAQKAADKRYREKVKSSKTTWGSQFNVEEAKQFDEVTKANGLNRARFIRWGIEELRKKLKSKLKSCEKFLAAFF